MSEDLISILERIKTLGKHPETLDLHTLETLYASLLRLEQTARTRGEGKIYQKEIYQLLDAYLDYIIDFPEVSTTQSCAVYTPSLQSYRTWKNVELLKDKGLLGYTLAQEIGGTPIMLYGSTKENYSYLPHLKGLTLLTHEEQGKKQAYEKYLRAHYQEMDVLILHGIYGETIAFLDAYRSVRPDGKVFCGLDMNSPLYDKITWSGKAFQRFQNQCDVIATSCTTMRDKINEDSSGSFYCRHLSNAFYSADDNCTIVADPQKKKNILLTVGRLGTYQKNNVELLRAFARALPEIPDWSLHMVGSMDPSFSETLEQVQKEYPQLREHLLCTGAITEKQALYDQYAQAKIFVLSSKVEGGTPNVYAEALVHGCQCITSSVDGAKDMTNHGTLGLDYPIGDETALMDSIITLCQKSTLSHMETHIPKALAYAQRQFSWERNAKKIAYCLFGQHRRR